MRICYLLVLLAGILVFALGCPRDNGTDQAKDGNGVASSTTEQGDDRAAGEADTTDGAMENPCAEENPCGENPCAENPCEENPCGENPCAENPCAENPCNPCAEETEASEDVVNVILQTTKGNITIAVHKDWAPIGAEHFLTLVRAGYYDGAPWFRVIPGFMCQTGLAADPAMTAKWQSQTINDEPVVEGNKPGYVSYGRSGAPNSRSTHFFINYVDNSASLDRQGFPAFGEVVDGMDVARSLYATGENPGYVQQRLGSEGIDFFKSEYPEGDVIEKAWVEGEE